MIPMDVDSKILYTFRGWIAFVAFMDLGTTAKSFIEKRSFLTTDINNYNDNEFTTARILGMFSLLKAIVLIYSTLYIHYKPVVDLGKLSIIICIILYFNETIYFHTSTLNSIMFPCILNVLTLAAMYYLPIKLDIWSLRTGNEEDNSHLLKGLIKRKKIRKKK